MAESVAQTVRRRRHELGLSQMAAAQAAGISRKTWCDVEGGQRRGSNDTLTAMATALELPTLALTGAAVEIPRAGRADAALDLLRQELVDLVMTLPADELKEARVDILERKLARLQARLEELV